jgi:thiol-disulfide isomerase/thioredoxin
MKILAVLFSALLLGACATEEQIEFAGGASASLSEWDDRYLVINYWAEWCAPCRHEIPELNQLHQARDEQGIVVLGVNYDGIAGEKLVTLIGEMGIEFPTLVQDPQLRYGYDRPETLPMTAIITPSREVQKILIGPQTSASIQAAILAK